MIGRLTGKIARRHPSEILLDVGGVGYRVAIPLSTFCVLPAEGDTAALEVQTVVRDDAILLFGFMTEAEKALFAALLTVSGVGPKVALAILSGIAPREFVHAVDTGDAPRLKSVPGVGKKLAERIVLELKEKIAKLDLDGGAAAPGPRAAGGDKEAESALLHLGYGSQEAKDALDKVRRAAAAPVPIEQLLREALRVLAE